jgi:hypothetical protein
VEVLPEPVDRQPLQPKPGVAEKQDRTDAHRRSIGERQWSPGRTAPNAGRADRLKRQASGASSDLVSAVFSRAA